VHAAGIEFVFAMSKRNPVHRPTAGLKPATECIPLGALVERARSLDALDGRLRSVLPAALAAETRLADCRNGRLVFLASSPTWAYRIRLHQAELLAEARAALGGDVERFAVKVAPLPTVPPDPTRPKPLSAATAQHLRAKATALSDPELRALYLNLASLADDS
jgi:hypothetical protein